MAHRQPQYSKEALLYALRHKAEELSRTPYAKEMTSPVFCTYIRRFGSWNAALMAAGLAQNRAAPDGTKCSFPGCENNAAVKGYCRTHYYKIRRDNSPNKKSKAERKLSGKEDNGPKKLKAGRKPSGKRSRAIYVTDEEYKQIKVYIETIRNN